jgi:hypothetical protein
MKAAAILILALGLVLPTTAQLVTNQPARLKNKVTSYEGKIGSGAKTISINFVANDYPGTSGSDMVKSPGKESELHWTFMGRNGSKDVYQFTFTRMTEPGSPRKTVDTRQVQFEGKPIVVFEDALHTVVMETPSAEDLKTGQSPVTK